MENLLFFLMLNSVPALLGAWMGSKRPMGAGTGFVVGLLFSLLGLLVIGFFPVKRRVRRCPECAEEVRPAAKVCRFCRAELSAVTRPESRN